MKQNENRDSLVRQVAAQLQVFTLPWVALLFALSGGELRWPCAELGTVWYVIASICLVTLFINVRLLIRDPHRYPAVIVSAILLALTLADLGFQYVCFARFCREHREEILHGGYYNRALY